MSDKLLEVKNLSVEYDTEISTVYAVNGLDLDLNYGETLGLVGETGAGKTTMVRTITGMVKASSGKVEFNGEDLSGKSSRVILDSGLSLIHI